MKNKYLCCDDYGQGAVWMYIYADSEKEIANKYPELQVFDKPPSWFTQSAEESLDKNLTFYLDDEPRGILKMIIDQR